MERADEKIRGLSGCMGYIWDMWDIYMGYIYMGQSHTKNTREKDAPNNLFCIRDYSVIDNIHFGIKHHFTRLI